jgi:menaquinone-dependent protoporphyrinogen oxidase
MSQIMIVVASRHGATRGIGERIGEVLRGAGHDVSTYDAGQAPGPQWADAVVIGGAAYMGKWMDEVTDYIRRHHAALSERPTWLFASGPVGEEKVDRKGRDVLEPPRFLTEAAADVLAQGMRVFFGRWDPSDEPVTLAERLFRKLPVPVEILPVGDFRDWPAIEGWARQIAQELSSEPARERIATG